jgi:hypothetical protein
MNIDVYMNIGINLWAVLACGVASMMLGFLWYGPLFSRVWVKEMGWDSNDTQRMEQMKKSASTAYPQAFIGALLLAYVFAHVLLVFQSDSVGMAMQGAFWMWLGFIVPVKYSDKLWGGKSFTLFFIDTGYYLVQLLLFAAILHTWQ